MNESSILALGGNQESALGSPKVTLQHAIRALGSREFEVLKVSNFYATPAFPAGSGPDYVNAAVLVRSNHSPQDVLARVHDIEADLGRQRELRWASRPVDIDLIAHSDVVLPDAETQAHWRGLSLEDQMSLWPDQLILPHPRLQDRAFVLVPVCDVAPDWVHPVLGRSMRQMLENLPESDRKEVVAL
ncbi:2-amino-4-hydroxy-6-hydroxymethyldihydropteridine diphosphokinase [Cognatishimia sp.]|uniref:2-amino-4-hydroxy-6- hydroxymethyldihydropteridine diphosphokinase n=1 Tax=Cognatishimia sp. TaxID=2211648 RepID=UPI003518A27B